MRASLSPQARYLKVLVAGLAALVAISVVRARAQAEAPAPVGGPAT